MIFVKGYGQMCNNILQYTHAYVWGKANGVPVVSMRFSYRYRYFNVCENPSHWWGTYLYAKILIKLRLIKCYFLDDPADVTPQVLEELKKRKLIAVDGWYFRFPELFLENKEEIKEMFTIKSEYLRDIKPYMNKRLKEADISLAVHIRRGDYKTWMGGKYYFSDDVYINHIRQFMQFFPEKKVAVFICTNDRKLNIQKYRESLKTEDVYLPKGNEIEDLYVLSQCDYILGVKSTFSLMASFYNDRPLYWIVDKDEPMKLEKFTNFESEFMNV